MQAMAKAFHTIEPAHSGSTTVRTTLYELIEAIGKEVEPGEDRLVTETVLDLVDTGQVKFLCSIREFYI